ncbi:Hcp family type VI secretion system effector [Winogradskyella psychrotolerans]|uniref:Hcp family type VI secretion system effector n=1 Tax=Winogradskyella psychrotolerans TaxID=1344585 RepID=UPI001C07536B|nr:type VI secretion system tube protein Hcp [Winogradskyella psychrotolerans]MBU2926913.1 type VI secretion system tube protein Hcp [Winogradskyella psychrotolerans]
MKTIQIVIVSLFLFSIPVNAQSTQEDPMTSKNTIGYLKIGDIEGESKTKFYEDQIEIFGLASLIELENKTGTGRARATAAVSPITLVKKIDAATPYLMLANLQGKSYSDADITLVKSVNKVQKGYFIISLKNLVISKHQIDASSDRQEIISLTFEKITIKYIEAKGQHEVTFDNSERS